MERKIDSEKKQLTCDVAVIGGGPAGMMAAIHAAKQGASVILVEKNKTLGKKLLITGGGRCNITNAIFDNRLLAQKYGNKKSKFLLSPLSKWSARDTINFFESNGVPTKIEAEGRVFPKSNSAQSVCEALVEKLEELHIRILKESPVIKVSAIHNTIKNVETGRNIIIAKAYILTTGGTARPETGSSGDGFTWLKKLGHTINTPTAALVPIKTKELWSHKLQGVALSNVGVTLVDGNMRSKPRIGKVLFTHFGLSGPLILNMSQSIKDSLHNIATQEGTPTVLEIDLFPTLDQSILDEKLREHFRTVQNKKWNNALIGFVPSALVQHLVEISEISRGTLVNKISRAERLAFVKKLKSLIVTPTGLLGVEKAIVSSGGVALEEIDFKTMHSQKIENVYLAGDILDFDRPSGGFSLQICWTTGFIAGTEAGLRAKALGAHTHYQ